MADLELRKKIEDFIKSLNIECYGFTECREFVELREYFELKVKNLYLTEFENNDINRRTNPFVYFKEGKTIISIAIPYLREVEEYNKYFSKYTQGNDYHQVVFDYLNKIGEFIKEQGYSFQSFCDTNDLPERYIAYLSGVGHIGRNSLIYTKKYGSYVFLGEIITDAKLCDELSQEYYYNKYKEIAEFKQCGKCSNCLKKCPNQVLYIKNFNKCVSNLTQQKNLNEEEVENLNGMIFGCDVCQDVCPKNRNIEYSFEEKFNVNEFLNNTDELTMANMDNKFFKEKFKLLACSWRGKNLLRRNIMIKNKQNKDFIKNVDSNKSEYMDRYKDLFLK